MSAISNPLPGVGRRTRSRGRPVVVATLAVLAAAAVGGAATTVVKDGTTGAATTTSRTVTVSSGVVQTTVSGSGNLEAVHQRSLSFDTAGTVDKLYVKAGDKITEGHALARLIPTDTTQATTWLRAPYSGTVSSVGVAVGDVVSGTSSDAAAASSTSTTSTAAFELVQLTSYDLSVSVSESDIGDVKVGQLATVTVSATGEQLAARVSRVGVVSSSSTSSTGTTSSASSAVAYPVTLRLTQRSKTIKPGMTASADIVTAQSTGLTVPTQALRGSRVTVVNGATQQTKQVQVGVAGDSMTEIVSGLSAGDKVLVTSTSAAAGANATGADSTAQSTQQQRSGFGAGGFGGTGGPPAGGGPPSGGMR